MAALVNKGKRREVPAPGGVAGMPRLRRAAWIAAQVFGWPVLVKAGLLTGFALAASVQHLMAA